MNKLTKISATALVALFLAACDKPAQKAPAAEPAKTTESAPVAQASATEAAKPMVEAPTEAAKADYQKLVDWNVAQEKTMATAQAELQQKLASQDPKQIQEGLTTFKQKVSEVVKSLESIEVSDAQIKAFKEKTKSVLTLSSEVLSEQVKAMGTPNDQALVEALQKKTQALIEEGNELQKLNAELQQRFTAK
ncbi:lipoprotein HlpB [Mannheimia granulomatis]|uniref:Lipoprotein HlpB n=1 Tax=Mannheimia granulomatis TaxID=85402 RepID=A0A6G8JIW5_9PAST|nr:lipoprotein HlpB [Mannheimia granulomatis]QIM67016.1 lipoprotein HlpB [Mannheimia granulomatis]